MAEGAALYFTEEVDFSGVSEEIALRYIAPIMEDILQKHIQTDIYGAYSPIRYTRRGSLMGNYTTRILNHNTIFVTSNAQPNKPARGWSASHDGAFLEMLAVGNLGWWRKGFPRPAVANAQKEIDESSKIKAVIEKVTRAK